jgi:hypothetical protein
MRQLRDFRCEHCGAEQERYLEADVTHVICECGHTMTRLIGMPTVSLEGISGDFPGAANKWATIREQRHRENARKK